MRRARKAGPFGLLVSLFSALLLAPAGCGDGDGDACPSFCPAGTKASLVCTVCGPAGGCDETDTRCVPVCATSADCPEGQACADGLCQAFCL